MAVPRAKKKPSASRVYTQKQWDDLRYNICKQIFPNFIAITLMGVIDILDNNKIRNWHLTQGEKARLVKAIADQIEHYCEMSNQGYINPFETRECFEKQTGLDFSKIWI